MIKTMIKFYLAFGLLMIGATGVSAQDSSDRAVDDPDEAMEFIQDLARKTESVWDDTTLTGDERYDQFRHLFEEATDTKIIAVAMLGSHYRRITTAQRKEYTEAITDYIISEFDRRMTQFGYQRLEIVGTTPAPGKRGHLYVRTEVIRDEGDPIVVDWRVRKKKGKLQIINLEVQGINLVVTNRELFRSRIKAVGIDGLIGELREDSISDAGSAAE